MSFAIQIILLSPDVAVVVKKKEADEEGNYGNLKGSKFSKDKIILYYTSTFKFSMRSTDLVEQLINWYRIWITTSIIFIPSFKNFHFSGAPANLMKCGSFYDNLTKKAHNLIVLNLKGIPVISNLRRYSRVNQVTARVSISANIGLSIVLPWLSCSTGVVMDFQGEQ